MILKQNEAWKPIQRHVCVAADGIPGPRTLFAVSAKLGCFELWSAVQAKVGVKTDGIPGKMTAQAIAKSFGVLCLPDQAEVRAGTSQFGKAGDESNFVTIEVPYPLFLAWDLKTQVRRLSCHKLVAKPLLRIFERTLEAYGLERIHALGLDLFGGCFNDRKIAGGSAKSMHAWGIAVDLDPDRNGLNTHAPKARFSGAEYDAFWSIVESEGAVSLGREKDYDWMHFQFAML